MGNQVAPIYEFRPLRAENFPPFRLDCDTRTLTRESKTIRLRPKALEVLIVLVKRHGELLTRQQLLDEVWGTDKFVEENNVDQAVSDLRAMLRESGADYKYIETVPGKKGFRLIAHVTAVSTPGEVNDRREKHAVHIPEEHAALINFASAVGVGIVVPLIQRIFGLPSYFGAARLLTYRMLGGRPK